MEKITKTIFIFIPPLSHTDHKEGQSKKKAIQTKCNFANFILMNSFASKNSPLVVSLELLKTLQFTCSKTVTGHTLAWPDYSWTNSWSSLEAGCPSPTSIQKWSVQPLKQKTGPVLPHLSPGKQRSSNGHLPDVLLCNSEYWCRSPPLQCPASPRSSTKGFHNSWMAVVAEIQKLLQKSACPTTTQPMKGK